MKKLITGVCPKSSFAQRDNLHKYLRRKIQNELYLKRNLGRTKDPKRTEIQKFREIRRRIVVIVLVSQQQR